MKNEKCKVQNGAEKIATRRLESEEQIGPEKIAAVTPATIALRDQTILHFAFCTFHFALSGRNSIRIG
jgi:hypothetical protein